MSEEETIKYRDAFPKDYDLPTYFTSKHAVSMTLRDYFAAKAMQGIFASNAEHNHADENIFDAVAEAAYLQADAMLAAREKNT